MDEKTLKLKPKEITIILQALTERPHKEVVSIINKIVEQTAGTQQNKRGRNDDNIR